MKTCNICKKTDVEFTDGSLYTYKIYNAERSSKWYKKNKVRRDKNARLKRKATKLWAIEYMGGKCSHCDKVHHPCVFDFHHISGDKEMNPSKALTLSKENARKELAKCILLCSNCHRIEHFGGDL